MSNSLDFRKDHRTLERFRTNIEHRTKKEKFLLELFLKELAFRGKKVIAYNYGVDNSGKLVSESHCRADYKLVGSNYSGLFEVKCSPIITKCTFKHHNLQEYYKDGANILLFYGTGYIDDNPSQINYHNTRWAIIKSVNIKKILDNCESFPVQSFGGKKCVRIFHHQYSQYFKSHKLTHIIG